MLCSVSREPNPLHASIGLFTTVPVPPVADVNRRTARRAMAAFPVVGLLVGMVAAALLGLFAWLGLAWLGAVLAIAALAALTGALHLDGVADTADGLGSRRDAAAALAVMKRSDIGPMGVIVLVMVLLVDVAALGGFATSVPGTWLAPAALMIAAVMGRVSVVWAITTGGTTARPGGFGALFEGAGTVSMGMTHSVLTTLAALVAGWLTGGLAGAAGLVAGVLAGHLFAHYWQVHLRRRLGGHTGDTFGSLIELTQSVVLVVAAAVVAMVMRFSQ